MSVGDGVVWNENVPDNSTLAHQIDDYDRDLRIGVRSRMNREHVWPDSQTGTSEGGHHRYITLQQQTSAPVLSTGMVGALYVGSSAASYPLVYENSAGSAITLITGTGKIPAASVETITPSGIICMWSGSIATIPSGWYLCDGTNGTPDLRDRFIVGAKEDDSGTAKTNVTGALTQSGDGTIPAHTHGDDKKEYQTDGSGGPWVWGSPARYGGVAIPTESYGTGTKNIAVYYALAFVMKA